MDDVDIFVPDDGVYAVVRIVKRAPEKTETHETDETHEGLRGRVIRPLAQAAHWFTHHLNGQNEQGDLEEAA